MKQKALELIPPRLYLELKRWDYKRSKRDNFYFLNNMRINPSEEGYSFEPFDRTKSIFVHIPKCAGVSVNRTLFGNLAGGHTTLDTYSNIFEPKHLGEYFKFTIVRNPWDRLVSAYFFLKNGGFGEKDSDWFKQELSEFSDFDDFVKNWVDRNNIWKWHHFRPQYHYMLEQRGKVNLDFVGFFENLEKDFNHIARCIGINETLPRSNASKHTSYVDYYNEESANIVANVYAEDIKMLGYSFDNSSLKEQLNSRSTGKVYSLSS